MISIINVITGNTYESKQLASQFSKLSISQINKSLKSDDPIKAPDGKLYKFRKTLYTTETKIAKPGPIVFPFGKYKNYRVDKCRDWEYMKWFLTLDNEDKKTYIPGRLKKAIEYRLTFEGVLERAKKEIEDKSKAIKTKSSSKKGCLKYFPFGKYKGKLISTCEDWDYLSWLYDVAIKESLKKAVRMRLKDKYDNLKIRKVKP